MANFFRWLLGIPLAPTDRAAPVNRKIERAELMAACDRVLIWAIDNELVSRDDRVAISLQRWLSRKDVTGLDRAMRITIYEPKR